jgi:hypothetical protein
MYILLWDRSDPYDAGQQDGVARLVKSEDVFFEIVKSRPNAILPPKQTLVFAAHHSR